MTKHRSVPMHLTMPAPNKHNRHDATTSSAAVGVELNHEMVDYLDASARGRTEAEQLAHLRECDLRAYAANDLRKRGYTTAASVEKLGRSRSAVYRDLGRADRFLSGSQPPQLSTMTYEQRVEALLVTERRAMHVYILIGWGWRVPAIAELIGQQSNRTYSESTVKRDYAKIKGLLGPERPNVLQRYAEMPMATEQYESA